MSDALPPRVRQQLTRVRGVTIYQQNPEVPEDLAAETSWEADLVDGARDRRSISSLAFSAIISPLLFGLMFTVAAERRKSADEITLPIEGVEYAPAFVNWLTQQTGVKVVPPPKDAERAVASRDEDVVLIIDKDFAKAMSRAVPASVKLVSDVTRDSARPKVARVRSLVSQYSGLTGGLRLIARGVAPSVATAVRIEEVEVSSSQQRLATQLSILPLLLVILGLIVVALLGPDLVNLVVAIALTAVAPFARVARAPTLALKERAFVEAFDKVWHGVF